MEKKKKLMAMVISVLAVLVIAGVIFCIQFKKSGKSGPELKEAYVMAAPSAKRSSTTYTLSFNLERGTYSSEGETADMDPIVLSSGAFTCEDRNGERIITTKADSGKCITYILEEKYLIEDGCFYDGTISDEKKFDAVCTYTDESGLYHRLAFRADGTYEEVIRSAAESTADNGNTDQGVMTQGTYKRDGELIKREADDGSGVIDFLVYHNKITSSYYIAD